MHSACTWRLDKVQQFILPGAATPWVADDNGSTLPHYAVSLQHLELSAHLIKNGAHLFTESVDTKRKPINLAWYSIPHLLGIHD